MESVRIRQGDIERIEAYFVNTASVPLSGLNPTLTIRRHSDKYYFTGNQDYTSVFTQVTMSAVNAVSQGGYYERTFDTTGLSEDTYSIISSGTGAGNSPQTGEIKCGYYVQKIDASIRDMSNAAGGGVVVMPSSDPATSAASAKLASQIENLIISLDDIKSKLDSLKSNVSSSASVEPVYNLVDNFKKSIEIKLLENRYNDEVESFEKELRCV